jgi:hypothetical protein
MLVTVLGGALSFLGSKQVLREWWRLIAYVPMAALALLLVWASERVRIRRLRKRRLGSAKGEFTVPDDFNDPLPEEIEGEFYKR